MLLLVDVVIVVVVVVVVIVVVDFQLLDIVVLIRLSLSEAASLES